MRLRLAAAAAFGGFGITFNAFALELSSPDVVQGYSLAQAQVYSECGGANVSPAVSWKGAPPGTKSFAVTLYDPDASGGWWHWLVYNIPANTNDLARGGALPAGALTGENDFGGRSYGGACPPPGSGAHHYRLTVWAMGTSVLPLEGATEDKIIGAYIETHALASASVTATYER
jgi:Raf kinase inhibitor-like YbhB/YbcL family protein